MATATHVGVICYFGCDSAESRPFVLRQAGYTVRHYDYQPEHSPEHSPEQTIEALAGEHWSAVILSDIPEEHAERIAEAVHSHSEAAVVLFRGEEFARHPRTFDCIIPPRTTSDVWLNMLADIIAIGSAARTQSRALRNDATALRSQASELRSESHSLREQAAQRRNVAKQIYERLSAQIQKHAGGEEPSDPEQ